MFSYFKIFCPSLFCNKYIFFYWLYTHTQLKSLQGSLKFSKKHYTKCKQSILEMTLPLFIYTLWIWLSRAALSLPWNCGKMEWKRVVYLVKYSHPLHFFNNFMAVVTSVSPTLALIIQAGVSASKPVLNCNHGDP